VYSTDERIEAIFRAAEDTAYPRSAWERQLSDAIDAAMSHAYAEGRADEKREQQQAGSTVKAIEAIWNLTPRSKHAA
jgi:hypothetical protein